MAETGFWGNLGSGVKNIFTGVIETADKVADSKLVALYAQHENQDQKIDYSQNEIDRLQDELSNAHTAVAVRDEKLSVADSQNSFDFSTLTPYWPALAGMVGVLAVLLIIKK